MKLTYEQAEIRKNWIRCIFYGSIVFILCWGLFFVLEIISNELEVDSLVLVILSSPVIFLTMWSGFYFGKWVKTLLSLKRK